MTNDNNPKDCFIQNIELTEEHIGSKVTYIPNHANGNAGHKDCEGGTIKRWNNHGVFVIYRSNTYITNFKDLVWG